MMAAARTEESSFQSALGQVQRMLKEAPSDPQLWVRVGNICRRYGHMDRAIRAYGRAIEQFAAKGELGLAVALAAKVAGLPVAPEPATEPAVPADEGSDLEIVSLAEI